MDRFISEVVGEAIPTVDVIQSDVHDFRIRYHFGPVFDSVLSGASLPVVAGRLFRSCQRSAVLNPGGGSFGFGFWGLAGNGNPQWREFCCVVDGLA